jgi:hypothetical protein
MASKDKQLDLVINESHINVLEIGSDHYISLTDMAKDYGGSPVIEKWLSNKDTIEFLGIWEQLNNPKFNSPEFEGIKNEAGTNRFTLSVKKWVAITGAIGVRAKTGRYASGTFAHKDIAFEFATYISPKFKLLIIKDYERLQSQEVKEKQWDFRRVLSKTGYKIQSNAIGALLNSDNSLTSLQKSLIYASEADVLNKVVFGITAAEWRKSNPKAPKNSNQRDYCSTKQLLILTHLESINANMINRKINRPERIKILMEEAARQNNAIREDRIGFGDNKQSGTDFF